MLGYWTDERIDTLCVFWAGGDSASIIASQMGTTRNAVLGKVHRLGLEPRAIFPQQPSEHNRRSAFRSKEPKPRTRYEYEPPKIISMVSPLTGAIVNKMPRQSISTEYTKTQLRAMLTQAVINTAAMK